MGDDIDLNEEHDTALSGMRTTEGSPKEEIAEAGTPDQNAGYVTKRSCPVVGIGASAAFQFRSGLKGELDELMGAIFGILRARTGHDFSSYKANTVQRRIERRIAANNLNGLDRYIAFLKESPREAQELCREILIGVTGFFRDPEAFATLNREVVPRLFSDRATGDPVRIWHACCSTGEEAYSTAILIKEYLGEHKQDDKVLIFATDLDEAAVSEARAGVYPDSISTAVGDERLNTFFTLSNGRYQVAKQLREMIVFAHHNLIKDPPFSRLDLIVCRNFLIYLNSDMQNRLISLFYQVLKPGGFLFLGNSETVEKHSSLFSPVDKKWRIFQRLENGRPGDIFFPFSACVPRLPGTARPAKTAGGGEPGPAALAEKLLMERFAPLYVVVNEKYEVVYNSARTNRFLEVPAGEPPWDILKMTREELRPPLRAAIHKALAEQKQVVFRGIKVAVDSEELTVNILAEPLGTPTSSVKQAMVLFEPGPPSAPIPATSTAGEETLPSDESSKDALIRQLEDQLRITHEQLQATIEQLETSNEGFMSTNEELITINEEFQSTNEELQATNEELETSKEELQALNEELVTVNAELQEKVEELNRANSDMEHLFTSSEIATIFLDRQLIIRRFSPAMAGILNLIPADIGRPFRLLSGSIDWSCLSFDAETVLETLSPIEREIAYVDGGRHYLMRILPYRGAEEKIDGTVVTLIDITEHKWKDEAIRSAALFPLENPSPVLRVSSDGTLLFSNRSAEPLLALWRTDCGKDVPDSLRQSIKNALANGVPQEFDVNADGHEISFVVTPFPERDYANLYGRDITERKQAEAALLRAKEKWERTFDSVPDLIAIMDDQHRISRANKAMAQRLGMTPEQCVGQACYHGVHGTDQPPDFCPHILTLTDGREHAAELHADRLGGDFLVTTTPLLDENGRHIGAVHIARDITERKRAEEALRESEQRVRLKLESILTPEVDIGTLDLADIIDAQAIQSLMDDFYRLARIPMSLVDLKGNILVGV
jgi:two-component system CheB/CheR fusion protein